MFKMAMICLYFIHDNTTAIESTLSGCYFFDRMAETQIFFGNNNFVGTTFRITI